jgi:hypothetical protein
VGLIVTTSLPLWDRIALTVMGTSVNTDAPLRKRQNYTLKRT